MIEVESDTLPEGVIMRLPDGRFRIHFGEREQSKAAGGQHHHDEAAEGIEGHEAAGGGVRAIHEASGA